METANCLEENLLRSLRWWVVRYATGHGFTAPEFIDEQGDGSRIVTFGLCGESFRIEVESQDSDGIFARFSVGGNLIEEYRVSTATEDAERAKVIDDVAEEVERVVERLRR